MQGDRAADGSLLHSDSLSVPNMMASATQPPLSPPPLLRPRSNTATERMRAKRSSSRMTDGALSRSSDDDAVSKTAVKVAVRVRPPLSKSDPSYDLIPQRFRESTCEVPTPTSLNVQSGKEKKHFVFDHVFDENTTQQGVWEYLSDSVTSFVQGYNVSILAYGQSGSGKSYTMGTAGPDEQSDPNIMGIVPRAARSLFEKLEASQGRPQSGLRTPTRYSTQGLPTLNSLANMNSQAEKNWTLKASYVEIYNEHLRDLLVPESVPQADRAHVAIREDIKGRILLTGLQQIEIRTVEDILRALNFGSSIRQTDATAVNARSSRSHAVFSLNLIQKKSEPAIFSPSRDKRMSMPLDSIASAENVVTIDSKLHFVDLAGSERLKNTGATGERAKEGISINGGLASLGKVISQLSARNGTGQQHISYRDSRLTRLLQDSLGGNAITFMVACVTPASFHLTETLNTLSYAQRARAIQIRPEIQQSHEDGDKQAAIEKLRAEVSFLRDQIRHNNDTPDKPTRATGERAGRKESELQMQLMDMQENYNALSQRHAKLISEISKARDEDADTPMLKEAIGDNAIERLKRSNSFAEAVEQVVLEYEKTIQSLETSLSKTRSSLTNTEETLNEKQTRIAYMETIQQQLQARMQKAMDREQNNESYLRDLEARMEGTTNGEEKNAAMIAELRRELARVKEGETSTEDYVSTLEERLAEAEQDQEIMQREIERLEHVIERQRSIGRLDNLLQELDSVRQNGDAPSVPDIPNKSSERPQMNGSRDSYDPFRPPVGQAADAEFAHTNGSPPRERNGSEGVTALPTISTTAATGLDASHQVEPRSPAQTDFMADKVENLSQELFDLRSEHEVVVSDYDNLQQKYRTALETLAKLEYDKETPTSPQSPTQSRPESFLADARMKGEEKELQSGGQPSSSRSVLAGLPSHGVLENGVRANKNVTAERQGSDSDRLSMVDEIAVQNDADPTQVPLPEDAPDAQKQDVDTLRRLHAENEVSVAELTENYKSLAVRHQSALQQVENLKLDLSRANNLRPSSPLMPTSPGFGKPNLRRKSDDVMSSMGLDRASRSFASLKNIALDNFEQNSGTRQSFEMNINTLMTELHGRSERVHSLEAELLTVKKEMESKQAIISGLTRERHSMTAYADKMDFSVVGQMRDQLVESENQIRMLHEQHSARETEFQGQIDALKSSLDEHQRNATYFADQLPTPRDDHMPGDFPVTPAIELSQAAAGASMSEQSHEHAQDVARLQNELAAWETKHHEAMNNMKASEAKLLNTIADLEQSIRTAEQGATTSRAVEPDTATNAAAASFDEERATHKSMVDALQKEVDEYKSLANNHVSKLEQLEQAYANILTQVDEDSKSRDLTQKELKTHRDLVSNLENQLQVHKSAITIHQESLESLQASHTREMEDIKNSMDTAENNSKERYAALEEQHKSVADGLQADLTKLQGEHTALLAAAASALGQPTDASKLHSQIQGLVEEGKELHSRHMKTNNDVKALQEELREALNNAVTLEERVGEYKMLHEEAQKKLNKVTEREKKSSRLVEELEEQLNSNFDSHQAATRRLSNMETSTLHARQEMERELEDAKLKASMLEQQVANLQRQSTISDRNSVNFNRDSLSPEAAAIALARSPSQASAIRKSGTVTALPTPPPSIPLPPLPGTPGMNSILNGSDRTASPVPASPPASRHASKDAAPGMAQLIEEQEARIRTIEKHLFAEKQLTATLEEALVDLETSTNRTKSEIDGWRRKCTALEDELVGLRKEKSNSRASLQAVEEEREMRVRAERARQALEQRMMELNAGNKKKKKGALNCF